MTKAQEKEVIRVCGKDYEETDIPTYIRNRDFKDEMEMISELERKAEEIEQEEYEEREKERIGSLTSE